MKKEINEYLCLEFGCDETPDDASRACEDWPFHLTEVGSVVLDGIQTSIFSFSSDEADYYAITGNSLNYFEVAGVNLSNFKRQLTGSTWIGLRNPVDLNTSIGEHPIVPCLPDRKTKFVDLANALRPNETFKILEGLFLEATCEHVGLIQFGEENNAQIVGDKITMRNIPFPELSAWRRLSIGIGKLIEDGTLTN